MTSNWFAAICSTAIVATAGCHSSLPHDHGVQWVCSLNAIDSVNVCDGNNCHDEDRILVAGYRQAECANPTVSSSDVGDHCKDDCESAFRAYGIFWYDGIFPWIWRDISGCQLLGVTQTTQPCKPGSIIAYNGGPANYRLGISETASTASVSVNGKTGTTSIGGVIDETIGPEHCTGPTCGLQITTLHFVGANFSLDGHSVTGVDVQNRGIVVGTWNSDGTFELPPGSITIGSSFTIDGNDGSETLTNSVSAIRGVLTRDGSMFSLDGDFQGSDGTLHLSIMASAIASPPVARLEPNSGEFECDSPPGIKHFVFSSASSSDPDNDITTYGWMIDGHAGASTTNTQAAGLPLGPHTIQAGVADSRGAWDTAAGTVTVVDTVPPTITATVAPDCLWPPNHSMTLYQLGQQLQVSVADVCDSSPKVRIVDVQSSQSPTGAGSGNTVPDVLFGDGAFCVRSERDGTSNADRVYTVTVEAVDVAGNRATKQVTVRVPHDMGSASQCASASVAPVVVSDDDPRCTAGVAHPIAPISAVQLPQSNTPAPLAGKGCSMGGHAGADGGMILVVLAFAFTFRRRRLLALFALIAGCSNSPSATFSSTPVAGTSQGAMFSVAASRATWSTDGSSLTLSLTNYAASCGASTPTPTQGQMQIEAIVAVPSADVAAGTYQLTSDMTGSSNQPAMGVTNYSLDTNGMIKQATAFVSKGALRIDQASASQIAGAVSVNDTNVSLTGTFSATVCAK